MMVGAIRRRITTPVATGGGLSLGLGGHKHRQPEAGGEVMACRGSRRLIIQGEVRDQESMLVT